MEENNTPIPPTPPAVVTTPTPEPTQPPTQPTPVPEHPVRKIPKRLIILSVVVLFAVIILVTLKLILKNKIPTSPEPTPTAAPDVTVNWKTYTNTETGLKFSIKYPEQLYVEEHTTYLDPEKSEEVEFLTIVFFLEKFRESPTNDIPGIGIQIRSGGVSLEEWISKNFAKSNIKNKRNVKVAGVEGMRFSAEDSQGRLTENVLISYRSYILNFYIFNAQSEDLEPTFNPMLSTFKFLDSETLKAEECIKKTTCEGPMPCMANPAAVFCTCMGGELETRENEQGQYGVCKIEGQEYDEWEYFRKYSSSQ